MNTHSNPSPQSALAYLSEYTYFSQNSKARYAGYLKGFLKYLGYDFDLSVKRPRLTVFVSSDHVQRLDRTAHKPNVMALETVLMDVTVGCVVDPITTASRGAWSWPRATPRVFLLGMLPEAIVL